MKAIILTQGSLDAFRTSTLPDPEPGHGEALVRMRAASLNFIDVAVATGRYPGVSYPLVPVADGAGEVVAVGTGVTALQPGDRVLLHPKAAWPAGRGTALQARTMRGVTLPGALRELATASADTLVKLPPHLGWEQAAALPITATTAWNALRCADIGPGKTVALLGTGGTAVFALQLAKARGARVIVTSSSDDKLARAQRLGADHMVNYRRTPAWDEEVLALTGGEGVDLVLETAGAESFGRSLNAARQGGTVFTIGFISGGQAEVDLMKIIIKSLRVQGNNTGSAEDLADAVAAIAAAGIEPVVDRVYGLDEVSQAYQALATGSGYFGKLAFRLDFSAA